MNRVFAVCLIFIVFLSIRGIELNYSRVNELYEDENFSVYAIIIGGSESIKDIHLVIESDMGKREYPMSIDGNSASIYIERDKLPQNSFTYYFRITLKDRTSYLYPENPALRIQNSVRIITMKEKTGYEIHAVYPERTSIISEENFHIAVYVSGEHRKKGLILDDVDITHKCNIGENLIVFYPDSFIGDGIHRINVTVNGFIMDEWGFTIADSDAKGFSINGNINIDARYYINEYDTASIIYTDTVQNHNMLSADIFGNAGAGIYHFNADIQYNDFIFNDFSNTYSLEYSISGMNIILGDSRILWNRNLSYGAVCRGGMFTWNRGIFDIAVAGGYSYIADSVLGQKPAIQYLYGINTGINMPNLTMLLQLLQRETMKEWNNYSSLYGGGRLQLKALGMLAVKADLSYRIKQSIESINPADSSVIISEETVSLNNAISGNIDVSVDSHYLSVLLFSVRKGNDPAEHSSIYDNSIYSGIKTTVPVMRKNADIGLEYSFLSYDSLINRQHKYSVFFNYHNSEMPAFNMKLTHIIPTDSILRGHILAFYGNISHTFTIMGKNSRFNLFILQHTGNYTDSINVYNKTGSGGNLAITWNRYIQNTGGFVISGYSGVTDIDEMTMYVHTILHFPYNTVQVNAAYSQINSVNDTLNMFEIRRIKTGANYCLNINGMLLKTGLNDYIEIRNNELLQLPEITISAEYKF